MYYLDKKFIRRTRTFTMAGTMLALAMSGHPSKAATFTWASSNITWASGGAWVGGVAPAVDTTTDTALFNSATFTSQPNYGNTSIAGIQVGDGTTVTGPLTLTGTSINIGSGGITVAANAGTVTFSTATATILIAANQNWANNSGSLLSVSGTMSGGAATPVTVNITGSGTGGTTLGAVINNGTLGGTTAVNINTTGGVTTMSASTNSFTGGLTLTQGVLRATSAGTTTVLGSGTITLAGGELQLASNAGRTYSSAATVVVTGNTQITSDNTTVAGVGVTHSLATSGTLSIGNQTLTVASGGNVGSGTAGITFGATSLTGNATFQVNNGASSATKLTLGALSGTNSLTKSGNGTLALGTAASSFSGNVNITSGTVAVTNATAMGTGTVVVGGTSGSSNVILSIALGNGTVANNVVIQGGGSGTYTIINPATGANTNVTLSGSMAVGHDLSLAATTGGGSLILSGNIFGTSNNVITDVGTGSVTIGNATTVISGAISQIVMSSTANLTLGGTNTTAASVVVQQGTVTESGQDSLNASTTLYVNSTGTFNKGSGGGSSTGVTMLAGINDGANGGGVVTRTGTSGSRPLELAGSGTYSFSGSIQDGGGGTMTILKTGAGTQTLSGSSINTSSFNLVNGILKVTGSNGSLGSPAGFNMYGGTFIYDGTGVTTARSQTIGTLTFTAGESTIQEIQGSAASSLITSSTLAARSSGATGNFVVSDGTNGVTNSIVLTGQAAGFINQGLFFNGSNYAYYDSGNFVRGVNWGVDAGSSTSAGGTSLTSGSYVQTTDSVTAQASGTFTVLNMVNSNNSAQAFTLASGATVVTNGILRSGNGGSGSTTTISSGTLKAASGAELVIRTDAVNDLLVINTPIVANGSNALTKSGAGMLTLGGSNTYTGQTYINGGILSISSNANLGAQATGAALSINNATLQATSTFGLFNGTAGTNNRSIVLINSGTFDVTSGNTLTVSGSISDQWTATSNSSFRRGSLIKTGAGSLVLNGTNTYVGPTIITGGTLALGSAATMSNTAKVIVGDSLANNSAKFDVSALSGGFQLGSNQTMAGHGTVIGSVTVSGGAHLAPGNNNVGTLTIGTLTLSGGAFLDYDFNSNPANSMIVVSAGGGLTINGGGVGLYADGTLNPWSTNGTYNLIGYTGSIGGAGISALSVLNPQGGKTYSFGTTTIGGTNYVTLTIAGGGGGATSTSYTLTASAGSTNILTGGTTNITSVITNAGTGTADTLNYAGLGASSAAGGSVSGSTTSGGPLAQGGSGTNSGQVFTGTQSGAVVVTPVGSGTNATAGGAATATGTTSVTVNVYDPASLSATQSGTGNLITVAALNASGAFRASAKVTADNGLSNNQGFTNVAVAPGTQINPGSSTTVASFDKTNRLNGTYTAQKGLVIDNVTGGGGAISGGTNFVVSVPISVTVSGQTAGAGQAFNATLFSGQKYGTTTGSTSSGYGLTSNIAGDPHSGTTATLINGTASANTTVSMSFNTVPSAGVIHDTTFRSSDILSLGGIVATGTLGPDHSVLTDKYVLQLSYDPSAVGAQYIGWYDADQSQWVNAIAGNSTGAGLYDGSGEFAGSYAAYLATLTGPQQADLAFQLNAFGYDSSTHTAWAVLNHNSEFAVIPEPSTWGMILSGFGMLIGIQRLRRRRVGT